MSAQESPTPLQRAQAMHREFFDKGDHEGQRIMEAAISALSEIGRIEMPKDYPPQHANADGWTDWISPTDIDMYGLQCCDCGLKHEMQFRVMRNKAYTDGEHWFADPVPVEEGYHVAFRMKRDAESVSTGVQSATGAISEDEIIAPTLRLLQEWNSMPVGNCYASLAAELRGIVRAARK